MIRTCKTYRPSETLVELVAKESEQRGKDNEEDDNADLEGL